MKPKLMIILLVILIILIVNSIVLSSEDLYSIMINYNDEIPNPFGIQQNLPPEENLKSNVSSKLWGQVLILEF